MDSHAIGLVFADVTADPAQVVVAEGGARHDPEPVLRQAGNGEIALDPAAPVQHLGVGDATHRAVDVVVAQPLQQRGGPRPDDLDLGEAGLVEQGSRMAGGQRLRADGG